MLCYIQVIKRKVNISTYQGKSKSSSKERNGGGGGAFSIQIAFEKDLTR